MTESEFWVQLMFRVSYEFQGLPQKRFDELWCDGFAPENYSLEGPAPRITGTVWIGNGGRDQSLWEFALLLPQPCSSRSDLDWSTLLPPENMTRWMSYDQEKRTIEIEPAVAVPDLA